MTFMDFPVLSITALLPVSSESATMFLSPVSHCLLFHAHRCYTPSKLAAQTPLKLIASYTHPLLHFHPTHSTILTDTMSHGNAVAATTTLLIFTVSREEEVCMPGKHFIWSSLRW